MFYVVVFFANFTVAQSLSLITRAWMDGLTVDYISVRFKDKDKDLRSKDKDK